MINITIRRGVNALFFKIKSNSFAYIDINIISANPHQPRTNFSNSELKELAKSISEYGVIQPITVKKLKKINIKLFQEKEDLELVNWLRLIKYPFILKKLKIIKCLSLH